jgi:hypothetical protein
LGTSIFGNKEGSANPFVRVEFLDMKKEGQYKKKTLTPVFNEQFFFEKKMNKAELEEASIILTVLDHNGPFQKDTVLGSFELDITSVYFSPNHELYQATLILTDAENDITTTSGLLKVSVQVLGPDDEPAVHDIAFKKSVRLFL